MTYKPQRPVLPKLYKVLHDGKSCNGGSFTWNTQGGVNYLPDKHMSKPLSHCSVGFHLTTDWRQWYGFGRDVYTATPYLGQILVKYEKYDKIYDNKVVTNSVVLSQKNAGPLAKLLKHFYDNVVEVCKSQNSLKKSNAKKIPPEGSVQSDFFSILPFPGCFVTAGGHWMEHCKYNNKDSMARTINFILAKLVKAHDSSITDKERQAVHDVWNLWKKGWVVLGVNPNTGKYVVRPA